MPTYDYQCATCGKRFEHFQSITSASLTRCTPELCVRDDGGTRGEGDLQRLVSGGAGLVFKGEGFYVTDYVRKGEKGEQSSGKSESGKSESGKGGAGSAPTGSDKSGGGSPPAASN